MKKYAKIVNEETKLCNVGEGNPADIFSQRLVPAVTHEEVVKPAEFDKDGNIVAPEERKMVVDKEEYTETITVGDYYKLVGMEEMDVEQGYDNQWYLEGHAPQPTHEAIRTMRQVRYINEADPIKHDYDEALARGEDDAEELKAQWLSKKDAIRAELPYPEEK